MQVNPAPNIYNPKLETTNVGASLKGWNKEEFKGSKNPGPSNYILPPGLFTGPQFTLGPKQVVSEQVIKHPGPAEYDINLQSVATSQPKYSLGKRISDGSRTNFPAPNSYSTTDRQISHNDAPKYSLKSRHRLSNKHQNPGPADYEPIKPIMDLKKTIKNEVKREVVSSVVSKVIAPGPSDYTAVPSKNHAPAYSIGKRLESSKLHETPSANAYSPEDINKVHGISLKSRGSPFVVVFSSNRVDTLRSSV